MTNNAKIRAFRAIAETVQGVSDAVENYNEAVGTLSDAWGDVASAVYAMESADSVADFSDAFDDALREVTQGVTLPSRLTTQATAMRVRLHDLWQDVDGDSDRYPQSLDKPSSRYGEIDYEDHSHAAWGDVGEDLDAAVKLLVEIEAYVKGAKGMENLAALFDIIAQWAEAQLITGNADPGTGKRPAAGDDRIARLEERVARLADLVERLVMDNARLR